MGGSQEEFADDGPPADGNLVAQCEPNIKTLWPTSVQKFFDSVVASPRFMQHNPGMVLLGVSNLCTFYRLLLLELGRRERDGTLCTGLV